MANDSTTDAFTTGALLVGGSLAGYFGGRWLAERRGASDASATTIAPNPTAGALPLATPAVSSASAPLTAPTPSVAPSVPAPGRPTQTTSTATTTRNPAPVSSPEQSAPTPPAAQPRGALSRRFDPIFDRHRGDIPIEYLRALAQAESGMDPRARARSGARGLLQITTNPRLAFNKAHGTHHRPEDLDDPNINAAIACWLLRFIATSYATHHPAIANMRTDWRNPRFVELLTFGWNAGFSEQGGVGAVVGHLEAKGAREVDLELVHGHARSAGAVQHLADPPRLAWCKRVVAVYLRERSLAEPNATPVA